MFEQSKILKLLGEKKSLFLALSLMIETINIWYPVIGGRRRDSPKSIYL